MQRGGQGRMDYDSCRSLPAMFFGQVERLGGEPFLWAKRNRTYEALSWSRLLKNCLLSGLAGNS